MSRKQHVYYVLYKHNVLYVDKSHAGSYKQCMDSALLRRKVGALIRARRKRLKMTQEALAARMGMSRAALANVETGRQNVYLYQLYKFAQTLEMGVTALLPDAGELEASPPPEDLPLPGNLNRLQRAQVARLFSDESPDASQTKGDMNAGRQAREKSAGASGPAEHSGRARSR